MIPEFPFKFSLNVSLGFACKQNLLCNESPNSIIESKHKVYWLELTTYSNGHNKAVTQQVLVVVCNMCMQFTFKNFPNSFLQDDTSKERLKGALEEIQNGNSCDAYDRNCGVVWCWSNCDILTVIQVGMCCNDTFM